MNFGVEKINYFENIELIVVNQITGKSNIMNISELAFKVEFELQRSLICDADQTHVDETHDVNEIGRQNAADLNENVDLFTSSALPVIDDQFIQEVFEELSEPLVLGKSIVNGMNNTSSSTCTVEEPSEEPSSEAIVDNVTEAIGNVVNNIVDQSFHQAKNKAKETSPLALLFVKNAKFPIKDLTKTRKRKRGRH